jgi:hypothetical protein
MDDDSTWGNDVSNVYRSRSNAMSARRKELEEQLAHLEWRRAINQSRVREILQCTRLEQQQDVLHKLSVDRTSERQQWIRFVIQDEMQRPLVVEDDDLRQISERDAREKRREREVSAHLGTCEICLQHCVHSECVDTCALC